MRARMGQDNGKQVVGVCCHWQAFATTTKINFRQTIYECRVKCVDINLKLNPLITQLFAQCYIFGARIFLPDVQ